MSFQQKSAILATVTIVIASAVYALIVFNRYQMLSLDAASDTKYMAGAVLILIPILFFAQLLTFGIFGTIEQARKKEKIRLDDDEMDKLIDKKISIISLYTMIFGFLASIALLLFDLPVSTMFIGMGASILGGGITGSIAKLIYCTRGV